MRQCSRSLIVASLVALSAAPVFASPETVTGQIVDRMCYLKDRASNKGNDHKMPEDMKDCAAMCAKKGAPMALLTADGTLYDIKGGLAADMNAKLVPHIGHTVTITGEVNENDGRKAIDSANLKMVSK